jgi:hypothetical protein
MSRSHLLASTFIALGCVAPSSRARNPCLALSPERVALDGTLRIEDHFGPPGFGEDTTKDVRLHIWTLRLAHESRVCNLDTTAIDDSLNHVDVIQLTQVHPGAVTPQDTGRKILAFGLLHRQAVGPEFLPVVMLVDSLVLEHSK